MAEKSFYNLEPAPVTPADPAPVQPAPVVVAPTPAPAPAVVNQFTPTPAPVPTGTASTSLASRHPYILAILAAIVGVIVFAIYSAKDAAPTPGPAPTPVPVEASLEKLGRDYTAGLIAGHADSLEQAASLLEKGETLKASFDKGHASFDASRVSAWGKSIKPSLAKIVPLETPNADVTADKRAALAKALREIAKGERSASR